VATPREVALPERVWVGTYEFPIEIVLPDAEVLGGADGIAIFDEAERGIYICASLDNRKFLEIVWHEITHAIHWDREVDDEVDALIDDGKGAFEVEESITKVQGIAWTQFLLDNPKFQRWLTYTLNKLRKERNA
jgi:hypothetical protein